MLAAHSTIHMAGPPHAAVVIQCPTLERLKVDIGVTLDEWNIFKRRWDVVVSGSGLDPDASSSQHFQYSGYELGDSQLKTDPSIVSKPIRCHGRHEVASRHRSSHRCAASRARSHAARAWRVVPSIRSSIARQSRYMSLHHHVYLPPRSGLH